MYFLQDFFFLKFCACYKYFPSTFLLTFFLTYFFFFVIKPKAFSVCGFSIENVHNLPGENCLKKCTYVCKTSKRKSIYFIRSQEKLRFFNVFGIFFFFLLIKHKFYISYYIVTTMTCFLNEKLLLQSLFL